VKAGTSRGYTVGMPRLSAIVGVDVVSLAPDASFVRCFPALGAHATVVQGWRRSHFVEPYTTCTAAFLLLTQAFLCDVRLPSHSSPCNVVVLCLRVALV